MIERSLHFSASRKQRLIGASLALYLLMAPDLLAQEFGDAPRPAGPSRLSSDTRILLGEEDPAVATVMESNPQTAEELVPAIVTMITFDKPELARGYAIRLSRLKLDEEALADAGETLGSRPLLRIITNKETGDIAGEFCKAVLAALKRRKTNPQRLAGLAEAVKQPGALRRQAIFDLQDAGPESVQPLVQILADQGQADAHPYVRDALVQMGGQAIQPLLAVVTTNDEHLRTQVLLALSRFDSRQALYAMLANAASPTANPRLRDAARLGVSNLIGKVPTPEETTRILYRAARDYLDGRKHISSDLDGLTDYWKWDDGQKKLVVDRAPAATLASVRAARIMEQLFENAQLPQTDSLQQLEPQQRAIARLAVLTVLQAHKLVIGLANPIDDSVKAAYAQSVQSESAMEFELAEDVLELAMERGYVPAAIAAAELLGEMGAAIGGNQLLLRRRSPQRCPLVRAAMYTDRRVRSAATEALVKLQPTEVFSGSSVVPASLRFFANVTGSRKVLVADPRPSRGQLMVGLLIENGFEPTLRRTGREAFLAGARLPEVEVILMSYTIGKPAVREMLHEFRTDHRTSKTPIGLIVEPQDKVEAEYLTDEDPLTLVFVVPRDATTMQLRMDQLTAAAGLHFVPHAERMKQAGTAIQILAGLSSQPHNIFDFDQMEPVLQSALYLPELAPLAAQALGSLGSASAQRALVNMANQNQMSLDSRRAAVAAFKQAVAKRGIGLTVGQIQRQVELYDQIAEVDPDSEEVLWSVLDTIQSRGAKNAQQPD